MKFATISGHECIFDGDAEVINLQVIIKANGYKRLVYVTGDNKGKSYAQVYLDTPEGILTDHRNGNSLDNRRANLREATRQQNNVNTLKAKGKELPKGVFKHGEGYRARLCCNGVAHNLGTWPTPELAETAYNNKAEELHGDFAAHISRGTLSDS